MAIRYRYDLYPRTNPRDGARLVRFTKLQQATYRDVVGVGSGAFTIRSTEAEAELLDPRGDQYVRVVREDTGDASAVTVGGFWIDKFRHKTADRNLTKRLVASGAGTMAYLARARMAPHSYFSEFHAFAAGQDPYDDMWRLYAQGPFAGGDFLGAVLWRVLMEASHFRSGATYTHVHKDGLLYDDSHADDRTASALPDMVLDFDQDTDSNGNAWTVPSGEFTAQVGESVLSVVQRLMNAGLYVRMDPDTFVVSAYEENEHRRDRTGSSWGTNVVRFQSPTDVTVDTGNMLSESERELSSAVKRSLVWAGGQDSYQKATQASDVLREGFEGSDVADAAALSQIASQQLSARNESADTPRIRIKMGRSPTTGRYLPWEEVRIEDLVTVHTGSGEWDYDEDTYPVAALRIELQRSGAWHGWAELGDSFGSAQSKVFSTVTAPAHKHPPNPELCRLPTAGTSESFRFYFDNSPTVLVDEPALHADWDTDGTSGGILQLTRTPTGDYGAAHNLNNNGGGDTGGLNVLAGRFSIAMTAGEAAVIAAGGASVVAWIRARARFGIGIDEGDQQMDGCIAIRVTEGDTDTIRGEALDPHTESTVSGTKFPPAATKQAREFPAPDAPHTLSAVPGTVAGDHLLVEIGCRNHTISSEPSGSAYALTSDAADDLPEIEGTSAALNSWLQIASTSVGASPGDLPLDTVRQDEESVGTSVRAARCDHQHAHGFLSTDETNYHGLTQLSNYIFHGAAAPTTGDDEDDGYVTGTHWIDDSTGDVYILTDPTGGAAVWEQINGGGAALTVEEEDGSPTGAPDTLKFPNGRLTDNGDGSFSVSFPAGGTVTVEEVDGAPTGSFDTIKFPNGTLTDNGDGSVTYTPPGGSFAPTWQDWTPTVLQPGSLTITIHYAKYLVVGDLTHWRLRVEIDSNGTTANDIVIGGQPAALQDVSAGALLALCGTAVVRDEGTGYYRAFVVPTAAQQWKLLRTDSTATPYIGSGPSFALNAANGDSIIAEGTVRTA